MYFGSVRFFKHLIITAILLSIMIPVTVCIALGGQIKNKDYEINELNLKKDALLSLLEIKNGNVDLNVMTTEEFHSLLNLAGVEDSELVRVIFKNNDVLLNEVLRSYGTAEEVSGTPESSTPPVTFKPETGGSKTGSTDTGIAETGETEAETEATAAPAETSSVTVTTEDSVLTAEITPAYQDLYPDLYADSVYSGEYDNDDNYVYLTFDDGPSDVSPNILYYLDKHNIKATFFVIPDDTEKGKERLNTLIDSGHAIGIHTKTHDYEKIYNSVEEYLEDFYTAFKMVEEQTGYRPFLFRFPGGSKNDYNKKIYSELIAEMNRRGFVYFDWNVDSRDALGANWTQMYNTVLSETAKVKRAVILFHDGYGMKNTVYVIEDVLKALLSDPKCYTFSTITEKTRPLVF